MTSIGALTSISFFARHNCWSSITDGINRDDIIVKLLTSYPIPERELLSTTVLISGSVPTVRSFTTNLKSTNNFHSLNSQKRVTANKSREQIISRFLVQSKGTITNLAATFRPVSFSVEMYDGKERWRVIFFEPGRYLTSRFIKKLKENFEISDVKVSSGVIRDFLQIPTANLLSEGDLTLLKSLLSHGFFELPRRNELRKFSEELNLSPSTISRRLRRIENVVFSDLVQRQISESNSWLATGCNII